MKPYSSKHFPGKGFEHAGANNRYVTSDILECPVIVKNRAGETVERTGNKLQRLKEMRASAALIGIVQTGELRSAHPPSDWKSLYKLVSTYYINDVDTRYQIAFSGKDLPYKLSSTNESKLGQIHKAAQAGISELIAFIKVIPHVVGPDGNPYASALRSKGFILHRAGFGEETDRHLAHALAKPRINTKSPTMFEDLAYDPAWFTVLPDGAVGLDVSKVATLRDERGKYPAQHAKPSDVIWGCAGMLNISDLYDATLEIAHKSELI